MFYKRSILGFQSSCFSGLCGLLQVQHPRPLLADSNQLESHVLIWAIYFEVPITQSAVQKPTSWFTPDPFHEALSVYRVLITTTNVITISRCKQPVLVYLTTALVVDSFRGVVIEFFVRWILRYVESTAQYHQTK